MCLSLFEIAKTETDLIRFVHLKDTISKLPSNSLERYICNTQSSTNMINVSSCFLETCIQVSQMDIESQLRSTMDHRYEIHFSRYEILGPA